MDLRDRLQSTLGTSYTLERELGGGGMSRVFLAHETALGRNVVVKVLSGDAAAGISTERFAREVRLAASLQHPNIVPLLTTGAADGVPYYTMPYVRGESLRERIRQGPIPLRTAISILRDVARALQYAHGEGVIHRDIKPENVLLSGDVAVVTDFGIAKAISAARTSSPEHEDSDTLTQAGSTLGTPAYMSPEQVSADTIDNRSDLYSWGIVAYELLAGAHPFRGKSSFQQMLVAQLTEQPSPLGDMAPDTPSGLAELVMRALNKRADDRPASAAEILESLETPFSSRDPLAATKPVPKIERRRRLMVPLALAGVALVALGAYALFSNRPQSPPPAMAKSIAVLPFAEEGAGADGEYFGEGIADELMTALAKVPELRVASRTSAIALGRRKDLDVREIGRQLGVATVVEGTVRRAGGQLRVTAQLTNVSDGLTMWSDAFERENKDVFAVQDDITRAIVTALRPELAGGAARSVAGKTSAGTVNPEAYDLYLRGLYLLERRGPGVAQSADYFTQAIVKDPKFARAYAGLADALEFLPYFAGVSASSVEGRARDAAEQSLALDPSLAEPHIALAMANWHGYRWNESEPEFKLALSADSTSAPAHTQYGRYLLSMGAIDRALVEFRVARRLDPLAPTSYVWLSHVLAYKGDFAQALEVSKRSRELDPTLWNNRTLIVFDLVRAKQFDEARKIVGSDFPPTPFDGMTANILQSLGDTRRAAEIQRALDAKPDTTWMVHVSRVYAYLLTDTARALSEMEEALERREMLAQMMPFVDRIYDPVRGSARFAAVVRKAGLDGRGITARYGGRPVP